jgi:hypothetical protein
VVESASGKQITMSLWKRLLLRSAGFGAGFALMLCAVAGSWLWYNGRPKPPKPWNKQAITAEYDIVRPEGDKDNLAFHYILQNNTDSDYRVDSDAGIDISAKLKHEKGFSAFAPRYVTTEYPIFVPAKSRVRISLSIPYPYPIKEKDKPTTNERKQYTTDVAKYVTDEMGNADGFVLFDMSNRYEIDFPNGWEQRAKQTPSGK